MSSSRGNTSRKRPQKHQNKTAYKNDLHDTSHKIKLLNSLEIADVCKRCKDIIKWKIKFKKYKSLTAPRKCVGCEEKVIKYAYHLFCTKCAREKKVCAKCCKPIENEEKEDIESPQNIDIQQMLKGLPERKRRSVLRYINRQQEGQQEGQQQVTPEIISYIENMLNLDEDIDNELENDGEET